MKDIILKEQKKSNIVITGFPVLKIINLEDFIKQPVNSMLYDLNRNEATILTFIDDPKWINDYAVMQVITALKNKIDELQGKIL